MKGMAVQQGLMDAKKPFFPLTMRSHSGRYFSAFGPMALSISDHSIPVKSGLVISSALNCSFNGVEFDRLGVSLMVFLVE
ncbi:hypothetical protein [Delftia sp. UME58]|uniref:hypothetical protein n=1 Tax=Delftia sp. UME58 TaxID=1862322 RepID=UPI00217FDFDF|nr:hypothetical protein [Delftia sp. UME58]